jgi:hypothetical protein
MNKDMGVGRLSTALMVMQDKECVSFPLDANFKAILWEDFSIRASYGLIDKKGVERLLDLVVTCEWVQEGLANRTFHLGENAFVLLEGIPRPLNRDNQEVSVIHLSYEMDVFHEARPSVKYTALVDALSDNYPVYNLIGRG